MKRTLLLLLPLLVALASCGTTAQYASNQQYPDGIYYRPQPVVELYSEDDFKEMAAQNLQNKKQADTIVVVDDDLRFSYYYNPYYYGPYFGYRGYSWSPYWYMGSLSLNPWVSFWTDPWFDPYWGPSWYYGGWGYPSYYSPYYYSPYHYSYSGYGGYHGYASGFAPSGNANPDNNYRRSGNMNTGSGTAPSGNYKRSGGVTGMRSSGTAGTGTVRGNDSSGYTRRSNYSRSPIDYSPRTDGSVRSSGSGSVRSSSSGSTRSSSGYSSDSSRSSGGGYSSGGSYSGGSSYSGGGGYSGGSSSSSSYSGGSGGGGGGRR